MSNKTELPKEWHELAQRESVVLNPSNENNQEVYRLAFTDGLSCYHDAMEKMLKDNLAQINKDLKAAKDRMDIISLNGEKTAVEVLLTDLQTITPTQDEPTT